MIKINKSRSISQVDYENHALSINTCFIDSNGYLIYKNKLKVIEETKPIKLEVYMLDEGYYEFNITKPHIFINNIGNSPLSDFKVRYYFNADNWIIPVVEDYWTPDCTISLEFLGKNKWCALLDYNGFTLDSDKKVPDNDAIIFGLHFPDPYWHLWDKSKDFSQPTGCSYALTENIAVFNKNGELIYGHQP